MYADTTRPLNLLTPLAYRNRLHREPGRFFRRHLITACVTVSFVVHITFLMRFGGAQSQVTLDAADRNIEVTLIAQPAPAVPPELPHRKPPQPAEPEKTEKREKVLASSRPAASTIQTPEPAPAPRKRPEERVEQPDDAEPQATPDVSRTQPDPAAEAHAEQSVAQPSLINREKNHYLKRIAAHLDKYKYYPRSARRRHIEGNVQISFRLQDDGSIADLEIICNQSTLEKAAEKSVYRALPLPTRPDTLLALNSIDIEYTMRFALSD